MSNDWKLVRLGDVFRYIKNGKNIKQYDDASGYPITRIETISNDKFNRDKLGFANIYDIENYDTYILQHEDILMSHINSEKYLGRAVLYKKAGNEKIIHGMNLLCLKVNNKKVVPGFAVYMFSSYAFKSSLAKIAKKSVNQASFSISEFKEIEIPLPSLPRQKEIAGILDKTSELIEKRKEQLRELDALAESVFQDMFGDPVTNEKGWEKDVVTSFVAKTKNSIKRGPFGGALKKEIFVGDGYLVYEQYHALNNDFDFGRYYIDHSKFIELDNFEVSPDDIIISCSGVNLGKLAIVPKNAPKGIINQALLKLTLDQKKIINTFFVRVFTDISFKNKYFGDQRGCAIPNFPPMSDFKKFLFPIPPLSLQQQFAAIIEKIEAQKAKVKEALKESEDLFERLMQDLFNPDQD